MGDVDLSQATVIKAGGAFAVARRDAGLPEGPHPLGFYLDDCRHLSSHVLLVDGAAPAVAHASDEAGDTAVHELTSPELFLRSGERLPPGALEIHLVRRIHPGRLDETIELRSRHSARAELELSLRLDADFAPMLEIRGLLEPCERDVRRSIGDPGLRLSCVGLDGWTRATTVSWDGDLRAGGDGTLRLVVALEPGESHRLSIRYAFSAEAPGAARPGPSPSGAVHPWFTRGARVATDDEELDRVLRRSLIDLKTLVSEIDGRPYLAAGVPWYATLFGRDALITAMQTLAFEPAVAAGTLRLLASRQGKVVDDARDEQPGRILHELRVGEAAHADRTPLARYYGTVDATALFVLLLCRHAAWTGSAGLLEELRPQVDAALDWLDRSGDADGDGLVEYTRRAPGGLENQGWKDSPEGVCDEHGVPLSAPVALVEAQAYAIGAREDLAALLERAGQPDEAHRLRAAAARAREATERLWLPERSAYAMALDGSGRPSGALASNQGHLLWAGACDEGRARAVRDRLMGDDLHSGWGIRTLGAREAPFDPLGYHTGSVWPHDTAMIAAGLRRYGFDQDFQRLADGLIDAAAAFPDHRLPELFAGFTRSGGEPPVPYPVACRPQAWAAGSIPYLLTTALGLEPDGLSGVLRIRRALLPRRVGVLELRGLRVAGATVDLRFERLHAGEPAAAVDVTRVEGDLDVAVDPGPASGRPRS